MKSYVPALKLNKTWEIVPKPSDRKVIGSIWVYKIKYKSNGDTERLKARLVAKRNTAKGHTQIEGFDYT